MKKIKKQKNKIKYTTGDIILLRNSAFTREQGAEIANKLKKPVIMVREFLDIQSLTKEDAIRALKYIINGKQ